MTTTIQTKPPCPPHTPSSAGRGHGRFLFGECLMSETAKHTPGPWVGSGNLVYGPEDARSRYPNGRVFICRVPSGNNRTDPQLDNGCEDEHSAADVRLIAAAPDLLEASEAVVSILDAVRHTVGLGKNQLARIDKLRDAIRKAKGGAA